MNLIPGYIYKYQFEGVYCFFKIEAIWENVCSLLYFDKSTKTFHKLINFRFISLNEDKYYIGIYGRPRPAEIMPITEEDKLELL
jgi:hypothetical protein